ncbi:MAG TPA: glycosyltransferase family 2 protein [Allosphingosinicella sp.]|uniref:glycosyltransferase family 2 protein n=1 Tax=Allosphingosinicella sp. TaxID=2823234 RepID=UPI002ED7A4CE
MKTLSLITASYNRAHTIRDTIRSVNIQTYPRIDHIVIDGASTDGSMDILRAEAKRVSYAVSEPDKGFYDAYNKGLAQATGDVIGFINTDDFYCSPDVIAEAMAVFDDPEIEGVHADLVYVDPDDTSKVKRHWRARDFTEKDYRRGLIPAHPTVFLTRKAYERVGGYDTSYKLAADYDFLLRAFYVHRIRAVHLPRIWVRMRTGGATGGAAASLKRQNDEILASRRSHGLHYPKPLFWARKIADRTMQRLRAPFVNVPG